MRPHHQRWIERRRNGETVAAIVASEHITAEAVYYVLRKYAPELNHRPKVTAADIPEIQQLRAVGLTDRFIARRFGVDKNRIGKVAGPSGKHTNRGPEFVKQARALWDEGLSFSEIARRLHVSLGVIAGVAHRNDFAPRPSPIRRAA